MDIQRHQEFARRLVRGQNRIFRYIVSLLPHRTDAEEVFQHTCLTLWENWERYDLDLDFVPWACGIAHNHVRNFRRKAQNHQVMLDNSVIEQLSQRSLERVGHDGERQEALRTCLDKLPDDHRSAVEVYYGGTQSVQQMAENRSMTPNAVYKMLRRIRAALRECIERQLAGEVAT